MIYWDLPAVLELLCSSAFRSFALNSKSRKASLCLSPSHFDMEVKENLTAVCRCPSPTVGQKNEFRQ